jgi:hypothetical protein
MEIIQPYQTQEFGDLRQKVLNAVEKSLDLPGNGPPDPCGILMAASVLMEAAGWLLCPKEGALPPRGSARRASMEARWTLEGLTVEDLVRIPGRMALDLAGEVLAYATLK